MKNIINLNNDITHINNRFETLPRDTDLNSFKKSGLFYCDGVINGPGSGNRQWGMMLEITNSNGTNLWQLFALNSSNAIRVRLLYNSQFSEWSQIG